MKKILFILSILIILLIPPTLAINFSISAEKGCEFNQCSANNWTTDSSPDATVASNSCVAPTGWWHGTCNYRANFLSEMVTRYGGGWADIVNITSYRVSISESLVQGSSSVIHFVAGRKDVYNGCFSNNGSSLAPYQPLPYADSYTGGECEGDRCINFTINNSNWVTDDNSTFNSFIVQMLDIGQSGNYTIDCTQTNVMVGFNLNANANWNVTQPIEGNNYHSNASFYIAASNNSDTSNYNVSYNLDGAGFLGLVNETDSNFNTSITPITPGTHNIDILFINSTDNSVNETKTITFGTGNILQECTGSDTIVLNITFFDEESPTNTDLYVNYSATFFTNNDETNLSLLGYNNTLTICSSTVSQSYITRSIIQYSNISSNVTYAPRDYVAVLNLTNETTHRSLFLLNETKITNLGIDVKDQNLVDISGHYIEAQRYDPGNNSFLIADSSLTDINGDTALDIDIDNVFYRFVIKDDNATIIFTTGTNLIASSPLSIIIIRNIEKTVEILQELREKIITLITNFPPPTFLIRANYTDQGTGLINNACLVVENITLSGRDTVQTTCSILPQNSSMDIFYTTFNNTNLVAKLIFTSAKDGNNYTLDELSIINLDDYREFGGNELFMALLVVGSMAGMGIASGNPIFAVIFTLFGIVVASITKLYALSGFALWSIAAAVMLAFIIRSRPKI